MSNSFMGEGFGSRMGGMGDGWPANAIKDAMDNMRAQFDRKVGPKMGRGDVRAAILSLLVEKPMSGSEIIHAIGDRSGGTWKPTPGSVYPILQLLTDEGLLSAEESDGRKTYSLTDTGKLAADAAAEHSSPWHATTAHETVRPTALPKAGFELAQAATQVGRTGNPEQVKKAVAVLEEARRKLYSILAED